MKLNNARLNWMCFGLLFAGILLRLYHYLICRSLWVDEAMLGLNIVSASFRDLFTPLAYNQIAPIGFIFAEKIVTILFGTNEYALRAIPFFCSIGALFLFLHISKRILDQYAVIIAIGLFAFADGLISHAVEVKPYSVDVFVALILIFSFMNLVESNYARRYVIIILIAGSIAVWFSFPASLVLAAIGAVWAWQLVDKNRKSCMVVLGCCIVAWLASFVSHLLFTHHKINDLTMQTFWASGFMPLFPTKPNDFRWYIETFFKVFKDEPMHFFLPGLGGFSFIVGIISMHKKKVRLQMLFIMPIIIALITSGFHLYPFHSRLILFIVPFFVFFVSEGLRFIYSAIGQQSRLAANILIILVFLQPVAYQVHRLLNPYDGEEIKSVLEFVQEKIQKGNQLYIYYGAEPTFRYYRDRYKLKEYSIISGVEGRMDINRYVAQLTTMKGQGKVWFIFSHVPDWLDINEERFYLHYWDAMGQRLNEKKAKGASAYLYDL